MRTFIILITILLATTPTSIKVVAQGTSPIDDPEAYAVYAAILRAGFNSGDTNTTLVALRDHTKSLMKRECGRDSSDAQFGTNVDALVATYEKANMETHPLLPAMLTGALTYSVMSDTYLANRLADPALLDYAQFPNSKVFTLSAVAFDPTRTWALVGVQFECGFSCAGGWLTLMHKDDAARWAPAKDAFSCMWIS
jgi:hypothetical protein